MDVAELDRSLEKGIKSLAQSVWHYKSTFVLTSVLVFGVIFFVILAVQPIYEGSTLLIGGQVNLEQLPDGSRRPAETPAALSRIAESEEVIRQAIDKVGLAGLVPEADTNKPSIFARMRAALFRAPLEAGPGADPVDAALPRVKLALNVKGEPNSDILRIAFRNKDPALAARFANAVAQAFIDRQIALYSRPGAADFFMRQKQRFDDEVKDLSDKLQAFTATTGTYAAEDQGQLLLRRLSELEAAMAATRSAISQKNGERQSLGEQLRKLAPVARSSYVSSLVDALSTDRTGPGPRAADAGVINDRAADPPLLLVKVYQDSMVTLFKVNSDLAGAQSMQRQQLNELSRLTSDLNKLAANEQEFARLQRAVAQAALNSDLYSKRMNEEQINAESNAAKFSSVKVIQRATQPLRPMFPNYVLFTAAGGLLSVLFGIGAVFLRGQFRGDGQPSLNRHPNRASLQS